MTNLVQISGYARLSSHVFKVILLLKLSTFVQTFHILDLTSGRHFPSKPTSSRTFNRIFTESWEPGSLWWRSKRSVPLSDLSRRSAPAAAHLPDIVVLKNPTSSRMFRSPKQQGLRKGSVNKYLKKMKHASLIKDALRRRDKLRRLLGHSSKSPKVKEIYFQKSSPMEESLIQDDRLEPFPMSRRTKMMEASRRMKAQALPELEVGLQFPHASDTMEFPNLGQFQSSPIVEPGISGYYPGSYDHGSFTPMSDSGIELFPNEEAFPDIGSFNSHPSYGTFGSPSSTSGSNPFSGFLEETVVDPFQESPISQNSGQFDQPIILGEGGQSAGGPILDSFAELGAFTDSDKDCPTIATKSCMSDYDCSCHGFYTCVRGRCDIVQHMLQGDKSNPPTGTWHDKPINFGFSKRSHGNEAGQRLQVDQRETGEAGH